MTFGPSPFPLSGEVGWGENASTALRIRIVRPSALFLPELRSGDWRQVPWNLKNLLTVFLN
jgi:hypothetical protein